ncbi:MAG: iron ABC transporter [Deltaproteobacteria bacterium]|nr:MAG: iron ABC transporter [Deltaproteobacteria bacterium]
MEIKSFFCKNRCNGWALSSAVIVLMAALPCLVVFYYFFSPSTEVWEHIRTYLLKEYILTSAGLAAGVFFLSTLIAVPLAWIVAMYDFPGKKFMSFGLALPLAIPPYIGAYTYSGIFGYTGFIQSFIRNYTSVNPNPDFFDIMNLKGAIIIFALFLYPYTYMIVSSFLHKQSAQFIEAGKLLGKNSWGLFFRLFLPLSKTAVIGGATLVVLEVLSDYGVVSYFGLPVFSTAIFKAWISFTDTQSALRLSAFLLAGAMVAGGGAVFLKGRGGLSPSSAKIRPVQPTRLTGLKKFGVMFFSYGIFFLGILLPVGQMAVWSIQSRHNISYKNLGHMFFNSIWLALVSSIIILVLALIVANYHRLFKNIFSKIYSSIIILGYSIPGTVIAVTMLVLFLNLDRMAGIGLANTIFMVIAGYIARYIAISFQALERGFEKTGNRFTESARLLGSGYLGSLIKVDIPMIKGALISAFVLTFMDIAKELPIVLFLRPFNFYTLSTKVFEYAHDEMIPESSAASLLIILISSAPMLLLYYLEKRKEKA